MRKLDYFVNCTWDVERQADYKTMENLKTKFIAARGHPGCDGMSGNLAMHVSIDRKTKKAKASKDWCSSDDNRVAMYEAIPSALALYRLCAFDEVEVLQKLHAINTTEWGNEFNWFRQLQVNAAHAIAKATGGAE